MLGIASAAGAPRPPPEKGDPHRYYFCKKEDRVSSTYICQKGSVHEAARSATSQRGRLVALGAGCPEVFDRLRLIQRLQAPISLGPPLTPK